MPTRQPVGRGSYSTTCARDLVVPNLFRALGNAPAALEGCVNFSAALSGGTFDARVQELIGLTVTESNLCDDCLDAHIFMSGRMGLTRAEIADAIRASAANAKTDAIVKLARRVRPRFSWFV
jgi:AhpD family alkylhydroperoxidase